MAKNCREGPSRSTRPVQEKKAADEAAGEAAEGLAAEAAGAAEQEVAVRAEAEGAEVEASNASSLFSIWQATSGGRDNTCLGRLKKS
jgi:hypothetical protein